VKIIEDEKIEK